MLNWTEQNVFFQAKLDKFGFGKTLSHNILHTLYSAVKKRSSKERIREAEGITEGKRNVYKTEAINDPLGQNNSFASCFHIVRFWKVGTDGRTKGRHVRKQWSLPTVTLGWPSGSITEEKNIYIYIGRKRASKVVVVVWKWLGFLEAGKKLLIRLNKMEMRVISTLFYLKSMCISPQITKVLDWTVFR